MSIIEDRYIDTAPCTQIIEQQDQAEGDQDLHSDFRMKTIIYQMI